MTEQTRWIATMNSDGQLEGAQYDGHADDGCQEFHTTYGIAYRAIASTKERAIEEAKRGWEMAQE